MKIKCIHWNKQYVNGSTRITLCGVNEANKKCIIQLHAVENEIILAVSEEYYTEECMNEMIQSLKKQGVHISAAKMERRRALYGYESWKNCFVVNVVRGAYTFKHPIIGPFPVEVFHSKICETTKLATRRGLRKCDWIDVRNCRYSLIGDREIIWIECGEQNLFPVAADDPVRLKQVTLKVLCYDIETEDLGDDGGDGGAFMISVVVKTENIDKQYLITKIPSDPIDGVEVINVRDSYEMYDRNWKLWTDEDPDFICGFNQLQFDEAKLIIGSRMAGVPDYVWMLALARSAGTESPGSNRLIEGAVHDNISMGRREMTYIEKEGRANIDLLQFVKKNYATMPSHSLSAVSKHFLKDDKDDVHFKEIRAVGRSWRLMLEGIPVSKIIDDELRPYATFPLVAQMLAELDAGNAFEDVVRRANTAIGKYCVVDSVLCCKLIDQLQVLQNTIQMAYLSFISLDDVYIRGVQWRITNLMYNFATSGDEPYVLDVPIGVYAVWNSDLCNNFKGATVLDPEIGYFPVVAGLDFKSLYPSIIINSNLCYTTIVHPDELHRCRDYETISIPMTDKYTNEEKFEDFYFAKTALGILPRLCQMLIDERVKVRNEMKTVTDPALLELLDCRQLGLKVLANSVYGVLGGRGERPIAPIAAVITTIGRERIQQVRADIEAYPEAKCKVIYGDTDSNLVQLLDVSTTRKSTESAKTLEERARNIGTALAKWVTNRLNEKLNSNYELVYEGCFEHYLQISKKCYVGTRFGCEELVKKGILSVKRDHADFEKKVYDSMLEAVFFTDYDSDSLLKGVVAKILDEVVARRLEDYVISSSFKSPRCYAEKVSIRKRTHVDYPEEIETYFVDKEGGPKFMTDEQYHKKMKFGKRLPPHAAVAMNAIDRGDEMMSNSRLDFVYFQTHYGRDFTRTKKNQCVIDYSHFFRNREFFRIDPVEYINRLINPVDKILQICDPVDPAAKPRQFPKDFGRTSCRKLLNHFHEYPIRSFKVVHTPAGEALAQFEWKARTNRCIRSGEWKLLNGFVRHSLSAIESRYKNLAAYEYADPTAKTKRAFKSTAFDERMKRLARDVKCFVRKRNDKKSPPLYNFELQYFAKVGDEWKQGYEKKLQSINGRELILYARHGAAIIDVNNATQLLELKCEPLPEVQSFTRNEITIDGIRHLTEFPTKPDASKNVWRLRANNVILKCIYDE